MMRKFSFLIILLGNLISLFSQSTIDHVILISIDGFRPDFYLNNNWPAPTLQELANNGIKYKKVEPVFPSVTYPSHTSLVTGKLPNEHGIIYNTTIDENGMPGNWITEFSKIKAETLWQKLKRNKLTTASFSWPVTVNSPYIDYNVPEIWDQNNPIDRVSAMEQFSSPNGFFNELQKNATGTLNIESFNVYSHSYDEILCRMAAYTINTYKPNFLSIHLPSTDIAQHQNGIKNKSYQVKKAVANVDHGVAIIIDALKRSKLLEKTVVIITGDHGFSNSEFLISPNYWLKKNNLLKENEVFFFSTGGSAFLVIKSDERDEILNSVKEVFSNLDKEMLSKFTILNNNEIIKAGGDKNVLLALTAKEGVSFDNSHEKAFDQIPIKGVHGHYPNFESIYTGLILYNPFYSSKTHGEIALTEISLMIEDLLIKDKKSIIK